MVMVEGSVGGEKMVKPAADRVGLAREKEGRRTSPDNLSLPQFFSFNIQHKTSKME